MCTILETVVCKRRGENLFEVRYSPFGDIIIVLAMHTTITTSNILRGELDVHSYCGRYEGKQRGMIGSCLKNYYNYIFIQFDTCNVSVIYFANRRLKFPQGTVRT